MAIQASHAEDLNWQNYNKMSDIGIASGSCTGPCRPAPNKTRPRREKSVLNHKERSKPIYLLE